MTQPHEVTVSDAEAVKLLMALAPQRAKSEVCIEAAKEEIRELIAARVPDAKAFGDDNRDEARDAWVQSHNALRAAVLRGPG